MDQVLQTCLIFILAGISACSIQEKTQNKAKYIKIFSVLGLILIATGIVIVLVFEKMFTLTDVLLLRVFTMKAQTILVGYVFLLNSFFLILFTGIKRTK